MNEEEEVAFLIGNGLSAEDAVEAVVRSKPAKRSYDPRPAPMMRPDVSRDTSGTGVITTPEPGRINRFLVSNGGNDRGPIEELSLANDPNRAPSPRELKERDDERAYQASLSPDELRKYLGNPYAQDPLAAMVVTAPVGGAAGKTAGALLGRIPGVAKAVGVASKAFPRATAAAGGAGEAAVGNAATGGDPLDPVALALGSAGRLGGAHARVARSPNTSRGRATQAIEEVGGVVGGPFPGQRSARGGMFDEPSYRDLPPGDQGTAQMAVDAEKTIRGSLEGRESGMGVRLQEDLKPVADRLGSRPLSTDADIAEIARIRGQGRGGAGPTIKESDSQLSDVQRHLGGSETQADVVYEPGSSPNVNTFEELRNLHKAQNEIAFQGSRTGDLRSGGAKQAAGVLSKAIRREGGEETAAALDRYAAEARQLEEANDVLYGGRDTDVPDTASKKDVAINRLAKAGKADSLSDETRNARIEQLEDLDPAGAREVPRLRARNQAARLEYGVPGGGSFTNPKWYLDLLRRNIGAADARAIGPLGDYANRLTAPELLPLELMLMRQAREKKKETRR